MTVEESLERYGLQPPRQALAEIRSLLAQQTALERNSQGDADTELMRLSCVQLFSAAELQDIEPIWLAKTASMDADASIDIQLLCGAGLDATRAYLQASAASWANQALQRLEAGIAHGDFAGFDVQQQLAQYREYYESEE